MEGRQRDRETGRDSETQRDTEREQRNRVIEGKWKLDESGRVVW